MRLENTTGLAVAAATTVLGASAAVAADDKATVDQAALDKAFDALTTFDWGTDRNVLKPIDEAVVATQGDAAAHKALETRLAAVLKTGALRGQGFRLPQVDGDWDGQVGAGAGRAADRQGPLAHGPLRPGTRPRVGSGPGPA